MDTAQDLPVPGAEGVRGLHDLPIDLPDAQFGEADGRRDGEEDGGDDAGDESDAEEEDGRDEVDEHRQRLQEVENRPHQGADQRTSGGPDADGYPDDHGEHRRDHDDGERLHRRGPQAHALDEEERAQGVEGEEPAAGEERQNGEHRDDDHHVRCRQHEEDGVDEFRHHGGDGVEETAEVLGQPVDGLVDRGAEINAEQHRPPPRECCPMFPKYCPLRGSWALLVQRER